MAEAAYIYERADGIVEQAASFDAVLKVCPFLAELAARNPELAQKLADAQQLGSERLAQQAEQHIQSEPVPEQPSLFNFKRREGTSDMPDDQPVKAPETAHVSEVVAEPAVNAFEPWTVAPLEIPPAIWVQPRPAEKPAEAPAEALPEAGMSPRPELMLPEPQIYMPLAEAHPETTPQRPEITIAVRPAVIAMPLPVTTEHVPIALPPVPGREMTKAAAAPQIFELPTAAIPLQAVRDYAAPAAVLQAAERFATPDESEAAMMQTIVAIQTYARIVAMAPAKQYVQYAETTAIQSAQNTGIHESSSVVVPGIDTFMADRPLTEAPSSLAEIQDHADDEPLETVIVRLAQHLAETPERYEPAGPVAAAERKEHDRDDVMTILAALDKALPAGNPQPELTLEMTEGILQLMRSMGYEEPQEALVAFIEKYDAALLLQAIERLCVLTRTERRLEHVSPLAMPSWHAADDATPLSVRVGRMLFALIMPLLHPEHPSAAGSLPMPRHIV